MKMSGKLATSSVLLTEMRFVDQGRQQIWLAWKGCCGRANAHERQVGTESSLLDEVCGNSTCFLDGLGEVFARNHHHSSNQSNRSLPTIVEEGEP